MPIDNKTLLRVRSIVGAGGGGGEGGEAEIRSLSVTENGTYTAPSGVDGYSPVTVNVPQPSGTKTITSNGTHDVAAYASAQVNVPDVPAVTEALTVTENGTYTPNTGVDGFDTVTVNVAGSGGGEETILGREYRYGSFTLAEDTTSDYVVADLTDWYDGASYNTAGFMFREETERSDMNGMWCAAYQKMEHPNGNSGCSVGYGSNSNISTGIKNGGLKEYNKQAIAKFTTSYVGYAGETYSWFIVRWKKVGA